MDARWGMGRHYLAAVVRGARGSVDEACRVTGLSRSTLYQLLREHGLKLEAFREAPHVKPLAG